MNTIDYLQIYSDSDGCSHFRTLTIDLKSNDYAPPAIPLNTSSLATAEASLFLELPAGWFGDWHPTPVMPSCWPTLPARVTVPVS